LPLLPFVVVFSVLLLLPLLLFSLLRSCLCSLPFLLFFFILLIPLLLHIHTVLLLLPLVLRAGLDTSLRRGGK
jgi:hypothetical protein